MARTCAICGVLGASEHHLLEKSVYPEFREERLNLVPLCQWHHTMSGECSPHGDGVDAKKNFNLWVKRNRPGQWAWWVEHSRKAILLPDGEKAGAGVWRREVEE